MNVTEIAKQANDTGEDPDWGRVMSQIPKVIKLDLVWKVFWQEFMFYWLVGGKGGEEQWLQTPA